jgi:hypothetical protein
MCGQVEWILFAPSWAWMRKKGTEEKTDRLAKSTYPEREEAREPRQHFGIIPFRVLYR